MTKHLTPIAVAVALSALAWIDPLYIPLITLGPILSGLTAGAIGVEPRIVALTWLGAGCAVLVTDCAINQEDVAFHAVVAVFTAALAFAFATLGARRHRRSVQA